MNPEDSVLMGVVRSKGDFQILREQGWYRIPVKAVAREPHPKYLAFFFGKKAFGVDHAGIRYYARYEGVELATRADLLPHEADHPRAANEYYKIAIGDLQAKVPPVLNSKGRRLDFIYTTWDRFVIAKEIKDLYLEDDSLVNRVFHALEDKLPTTRLWQMEGGYPAHSAQLRVLCESGEVLASTHPDEGIPITDDVEGSVERIQKEVDARGGPRMISTPLE